MYRWAEVTKRLRLDVNIQELTDEGVYDNVDIVHNPDISTIGVFQLKQVIMLFEIDNRLVLL